MANNNSINIGGVSFTKTDVVKSEQIKQNGETLNSVFLKDGTQITFPNQSKENESRVFQSEEAVSGYHVVVKTGNTLTGIERMSGGHVVGTDKKDNITLSGCNNMTVDVSQNDGKMDTVTVKDGSKGGIFDKTTYESSNNVVKQGAGDVSFIEKPENEQSLFNKSDKNKGAGEFKERD